MILSVYVFSLPRNVKTRSVMVLKLSKNWFPMHPHLNVNQSVHLNWWSVWNAAALMVCPESRQTLLLVHFLTNWFLWEDLQFLQKFLKCSVLRNYLWTAARQRICSTRQLPLSMISKTILKVITRPFMKILLLETKKAVFPVWKINLSDVRKNPEVHLSWEFFLMENL